jgi:hypothetical protein
MDIGFFIASVLPSYCNLDAAKMKGENFSESDWQHFETAGDRGVIAMKTIASPVSTRRVEKFARPPHFNFEEPAMSDSFGARLLPVLGLILAVMISPRLAYAQTANGDSTWAVIDVISAIDGAIEKSKGGVELREKVVRRFSECSLMYGALFKLASNTEAKKNYFHAQEATMEVQSAIAQPLQSERSKEIEESAKKSVAKMLDVVKRNGEKELTPFFRSCKSLNELKEINNALRELSLE